MIRPCFHLNNAALTVTLNTEQNEDFPSPWFFFTLVICLFDVLDPLENFQPI